MTWEPFAFKVVSTVVELLRETKGRAFSTTPRRVAIKAGLKACPLTYHMIRYILEELGFTIWHKGFHGYRMVIDDSAEIWKIAKIEDRELRSRMIENIVKKL